MKYRIVIEKPALKFLQKQPQHQRERLLKAIQALPNDGILHKKLTNKINGKYGYHKWFRQNLMGE